MLLQRFFRIFLLLITFTQVAQAQNPVRKCGTNEATAALIKQHPEQAAKLKQAEREVTAYLSGQRNQRTKQNIITIPVVFHVVYSSVQQNISEAQLRSQVDVLNEDFRRRNADSSNTPAAFRLLAADTHIEFCLATVAPDGKPTNGITRTSTNTTSFTTNNNVKFANRGGQDAWPSDRYLNIWIANLADNVLGYAQVPGGMASTDGVVLHYTSVGRPPYNPFLNASPYNLGRTATHEVGHWLGLKHIWGNSESGCSDDDGIADTPVQDKSTAGCPNKVVISCNNSPAGDMWQNYMDYTNDGCMNLFTKGQAAFMQGVLNSTRKSFQSANSCSTELIAEFVATDSLITAGDTISFTDRSFGPRTNWFWTFEGGTPATSDQPNPKGIKFNTPGIYTVTLTISNDSLADTETKVGYIVVRQSGIQIYPVPATDELIIVLPSAQIPDEIYLVNATGQLVKRISGQRNNLVTVRGLAGGVYFVRIIKGNDVQNFKIMIN